MLNDRYKRHLLEHLAAVCHYGWLRRMPGRYAAFVGYYCIQCRRLEPSKPLPELRQYPPKRVVSLRNIRFLTCANCVFWTNTSFQVGDKSHGPVTCRVAEGYYEGVYEPKVHQPVPKTLELPL